MDTVRDLGRIEPWQDSLERSLARRNRSSGSVAPRRDRPRIRSRQVAPSRILVRRAGAIVALAVLSVGGLSTVGGRRARGSSIATAARPVPAQVHPQYAGLSGAGPLSRWPFLRVTGTAPADACQPVSRPGDYVNPLGGARVRPERIDQGVDYAGSGPLVAVGAARVTYLATADTGWPGAFIEYRLLNGPDAGCYVYYAEGVNPAGRLRVGATIAAGQAIASIISGWPTGIELGWGAGISTATYAEQAHQWSATSDQDSVPTAAGKSFSALIAALGGPPGKIEGDGG